METVQYGTQHINFYLKKVDRKTLAIEVHPDMSVWAVSPEDTKLSEVKKVVVKRASWIVKQQRYFEQFLPRTPEREYVSGETHLYLGRRYILRIRKGKENTVKLIGPDIIVFYTGDKSTKKTKQLLTSWYYNHAKLKFEKTVDYAVEKFKHYNIRKPELEIRRMKKRWGSYAASEKVMLNPELIKSPGKCIEYVVIHELCHTVHPNHGANFYKLLGELMPEYSKWKDRLEQFMV